MSPVAAPAGRTLPIHLHFHQKLQLAASPCLQHVCVDTCVLVEAPRGCGSWHRALGTDRGNGTRTVQISPNLRHPVSQTSPQHIAQGQDVAGEGALFAFILFNKLFGCPAHQTSQPTALGKKGQ